jgi:hypothetical protein
MDNPFMPRFNRERKGVKPKLTPTKIVDGYLQGRS